MNKATFALINRVYRKLARHAYHAGNIEALMEVPAEFLPESVVFRMAELPSQLGSSFHSEIAAHSRSWYDKAYRTDLPEWALDNKLAAYQFAKKLGIRTPVSYQSKTSWSELDYGPDRVIKPEEGYQSRGVFLVDQDGLALDVEHNTTRLGKDDVFDRVETLLKTGLVQQDLWCGEEIITDSRGKPAPDAKFFCFYGECKMALKRELSSEHGMRFQCIDRQGQTLVSRAHPGSDLSHIEIHESDFELAENFSSELPTPFMRLDFLRGEELVFGEIGNLVGHFGEFGTELDRLMGSGFIDARSRLLDDLRKGKSFTKFDDFLNDVA